MTINLNSQCLSAEKLNEERMRCDNMSIEFLKTLTYKSSKFLIRVPMLNRSWIDVYKKELGLEYRLDNTHFIEYTFEGFKEELDEAGLSVLDYSIQFGEIWAEVGKIVND